MPSLPPRLPLSRRHTRRFPGSRTGTPARAALAFLLGVAGCKGWHVEPMPPAELVEQRKPEVVRIDRSSDSSRVVMYSPTVVRDSLRGLPTELAIRAITIPIGDIKAIAVRQFSLGKTLLLGLAIAGGVLAYELLQSLNTGPTF